MFEFPVQRRIGDEDKLDEGGSNAGSEHAHYAVQKSVVFLYAVHNRSDQRAYEPQEGHNCTRSALPSWFSEKVEIESEEIVVPFLVGTWKIALLRLLMIMKP